MRHLALTPSLAAAASALAVVVFTPPASSAAGQSGVAAVTCTNPVSHANWQISIDYDRNEVDSHPATISDAQISWHTPGGENYKLDRKSGDLTVVVASSTGGYF